MAMMLLVGTNAWADVTTADLLKDAFENASNGDVIKLGNSITCGHQLKLNVDGYVVLDLNGGDLVMDCNFGSNSAAIVVEHGRLEIKGGDITTGTNAANIYDLIRVIGTTETGIDAATETPYSQVIIDAGVTVTNNIANAMTITENATKVNNKSYANGARIDVYGIVTGTKYGIKVNGSIQKPDDVTDAPYVYIHKNSQVLTNASATNAVAVYSSGYGRWLIEGTCSGSTGVYIKGGEVVLDGANITTTTDYNTNAQTGGSSGVTAGGSAIVIESNVNYPGDSELTVTGNTTVTATNGYAIEEKLDGTNAAGHTNQVDNITIESGTITGGAAGAIVVTSETTSETTIFGGNINAVGNSTPIQVTGVNTNVDTSNMTDAEAAAAIAQANADAINSLLPTGTSVTPSATTNTGTNTTTIVINAGYHVTLNAYGLSTFSAAERTLIPTGLTAYAAGNLNANQELVLEAVAGAYIPENTGVILYDGSQNGANKSYSMAINTNGTASTAFPTTNNLKADWNAKTAATVYILHGNELWEYTGADFPANKAYLQLPGNSAPKRINMVFAETEQTEAVENVEAESVKAVKFMGADGQLYIRRGDVVYTVQGQVVK